MPEYLQEEYKTTKSNTIIMRKKPVNLLFQLPDDL